MRAQDDAVVQERGQVALVGNARAGGHRPRCLGGVLRLHREQRARDGLRVRSVRRDQMLAAQAPSGDVDVLHRMLNPRIGVNRLRETVPDAAAHGPTLRRGSGCGRRCRDGLRLLAAGVARLTDDRNVRNVR